MMKKPLMGICRIPESITLSGFRIKTLYNPTLLADRERYGEYCSRTMTITLDSNLSDQRKALTYVHELVEAIKDINHVDMDESTIQAVGIGIHQIILQNNILFAQITEED
jgi:hypothetical protein